MTKITLVNPAIPYSSWNAKIGHGLQENTLIRLGLAYLSSALKLNGHDVSLIDLRLLSGWHEYDEELLRLRPDILGVTMETGEYDFALRACKMAKEVLPKIHTIIGGIHPTMFAEDCDFGSVNTIFRGEGEVTLPKFVEDPSNFPRIFYGETPDLDKIPFPDRWLWSDYGQRILYDPIGLLTYRFPIPVVDIMTKRGCPWSCSFCVGPGEQTLYTKPGRGGRREPSIRTRSVENVMEELNLLHKYCRFRTIYIHDDQFILNPKWNWQFVEAMHDYGWVKKGIKWICSCRADIICKFPDLIEAMRRAGLELMLIGFESFNQRVLDWVQKGTTVEQNRECARILKRLGVRIWANYILGIPLTDGWHREYDIETVRGLWAIRPDRLSPSFFTPIPGSQLYDWCKEKDLIAVQKRAHLGSRSPNRRQIKGVDYNFLRRIMITDEMVHHPFSPILRMTKQWPVLQRKVLRLHKRWVDFRGHAPTMGEERFDFRYGEPPTERLQPVAIPAQDQEKTRPIFGILETPYVTQ